MQADYNSFQTPSVQIEQKYAAKQRPSKIQQYRWMYNHWPDEVDVPKETVVLAQAETAASAKDTGVDLAVGQSPVIAEPDASTDLPPENRSAGRPFDVRESASPPSAISPSQLNLIAKAEEIPPFDIPIRAPVGTITRTSASQISTTDDIEQAAIREIPDFSREESSGDGTAPPRPNEMSAAPTQPANASTFPQRWTNESGSNQPLTAAKSTENKTPDPNATSDSAVPRDLIQRRRPDQIAADPRPAPTRLINNSPRTPEWWGSAPSKTTPETEPKRTTQDASDDDDYSVEGMFEIR